MCCADMSASNGTCDVCTTVLYEVSMNHMYQTQADHPRVWSVINHHTIGVVSPSSVHSQKPTGGDKLLPHASEGKQHDSCISMQIRVTGGSTGAVYQRRAQFRVALASYQTQRAGGCAIVLRAQGRATRNVPLTVIDSVRKHIETTASHLVDSIHGLDEPLMRYARITRVHVMCILRSTPGGIFSRWYRDSHFFHHVITKQQPPNQAVYACCLTEISVTRRTYWFLCLIWETFPKAKIFFYVRIF